MHRCVYRLSAVLLCVVAVFVLGEQASAQRQNRPDGPTAEGTEFMVPMRDGVKLATDVYLPEGEGPWPVILSRTPYSKRRGPRSAVKYVGQGYAYVLQDCRGRFNSEGAYEPYQPDREDGYDTIEWIAAQPWSNGKVGMSGRSAAGINSNLAASAAPPHLTCVYIVTASQTLFDESYFMGGVFREHFRGNFMRLQGVEDQIPIMKARAILDEQWKRTDMVHHRDKVNVPMYQIGGWFDMFAKGAVGNFVFLQNHGREGARGNQKLWIGPWGHSRLDGDLDYAGARGLSRGFEEEMRWFEYWLKGVDNGIMDEPAVTYYHTASARKGAVSKLNGLRTAENWPPPSTDTRFYLHAGFGMSARRPTEDHASTSYIHDPANPVPTLGGANYNNNRDYPITVGPVDQREIGERPDYLRFQTEPLEEDLTIQGRMELELWASTDAPDTDFMVKLVDVYPDGYEAILLDSPLRARYRYGREPGDVEMMKPGRPTLLIIDLWSISQTFEKGHRLAVHISSSNYPRFEVNPNTGEPAGRSTMKPRIATNVVFHDQMHPTAIVLPVVSD